MRILKYVKPGFRKLMSLPSNNSIALKLFNVVYERLPTSLISRIEPMMPVPGFDYTWQINLGSEKLFFTYKKGEARNIYHFPLSYKKNDYGIRMLEKIIHKTVQKDKLYFDLGANFGLRSLYYISQGRSCYLFEPNDICNAITQRLIEENDLSNVTIVSKAVGAVNGQVKFHRSVSTYLSSVNAEYPHSCDDYLDTITKEMITVDDYILKNGLKGKVGIVKIDVEGFENEVCEGATQLLENNTLTVLIEVTTTPEKRTDLYSKFSKSGYNIYAIKPSTSQMILVKCSNTFFPEYFDFLCTNDVAMVERLKEFTR
jgi:FkbM family methyltransferase